MKSKNSAKIIFLISSVFILFSCSNSKNQDAIKEQINKHEKEVAALNAKIIKLKSQLSDSSKNSMKHRILVRSKVIKPITFKHYIEVNGTVEAVHDAFISPQMNGQIKAIYVDEGDRVKKGDFLAALNSDVTDKSIEELKTGLELARTTYEKQKELWEQNIGSEIQYLQAKNAKESLEKKLETLQAQKEMSLIIAPFNGIVDGIFQKVGELGIPGRQMMQLINLDDLFINADISEEYLPVIYEGELVDVHFPSYPDIKMQAQILRTGNTINTQNRTFTIKLSIDNIQERIKPNMLALLEINDYTAENALVVPSIIIKQDIIGKYIYIKEMKGNEPVAKKVYIETGKSFDGETMITKGISAGDEVIVEGYNIVSDGSSIRFN